MRKEVLFRFDSFNRIQSFVDEVNVISLGSIPSKNILRCLCSKDQIDLAIAKYKAIVINQMVEKIK
jgi:hypothetical protein